MPITLRPGRHVAPPRSLRVALPVGLATLMLVGLAPVTLRAADPVASGPSVPPTVHFEEAVRHGDDPTRFAPGGRVSVAFEPRTGDTWAIDGRSPSVLPAGRLSGEAMRVADRTPSTGRSSAGPARVGDDRPAIDPRALIGASTGRWDPADAGSIELAAAVDPGALRREVFGFLPYWELSDDSTRIDWPTVSTIAYFGVGAAADGSLIKRNADGLTTVGWSGWTSDRMTRVIEAAHRNGTRVVLTVQSFGWTSAGLRRQRALLKSPAARARLARQIAAAVRDRGADGVNLDFEPIAKGYGKQFAALVRSVRRALDRQHRGYQLTFDATGSIGEYPIREATRKGAADAVVVMGYDYRNGASKVVGSVAPIDGPGYDIGDTIRAYLRQAPASKVILGVPYYGRAWSTPNSKLNARNISGEKYGPSVTVVYDNARAVSATTGRRYDTAEGVAWTAYRRENCTKRYGCVTTWRQLYYDDAAALKAKYDLVNHYGLRGVGIWALGYDGSRRELSKAIVAKFIRDKVPPIIAGAALSSAVISPNGDGRADATTASLKVTGLIRWGATIQAVRHGKVGRTIRSGTHPGKTPRITWDGRDSKGRGVKDGTYRVTLWAADINGNRSERRFTVTVDRTPAPVRATAGSGYLTPGHDGQTDTLALAWTAPEAISGGARIIDARGKVVRRWSFSGLRAWVTTWSGKGRGGRIVADGRYTFRVIGLDGAGNRTVRDRPFIVDRTITAVRWDRTTFRPAAKQTARATIRLARSAVVSVRILRGQKVIAKGWTNRSLRAGSTAWTWTGRTTAGKLAPAGAYVIEVTATSRIGLTRYRAAITVAGS